MEPIVVSFAVRIDEPFILLNPCLSRIVKNCGRLTSASRVVLISQGVLVYQYLTLVYLQVLGPATLYHLIFFYLNIIK